MEFLFTDKTTSKIVIQKKVFTIPNGWIEIVSDMLLDVEHICNNNYGIIPMYSFIGESYGVLKVEYKWGYEKHEPLGRGVEAIEYTIGLAKNKASKTCCLTGADGFLCGSDFQVATLCEEKMKLFKFERK